MDINSVSYFEAGTAVAHIDLPHTRLEVQRVDMWVLKGCRRVRYGVVDACGARKSLDSTEVVRWLKFKVGDVVEFKFFDETRQGVVMRMPNQGRMRYDVERHDKTIVPYWQGELTLVVDCVSPHYFQD